LTVVARGRRLLAAIPLALFACVAQEQAQAAAAQKAYGDCVAQHSKAYPDCVALEERALAAQRRYQENSRRAWACDPAQEQCPTPR
jgi:hypothetical protein